MAGQVEQHLFGLGLLGLVQPVQPTEHRADRPRLIDADPSRRRSLGQLRMLSELLGLVQHPGGFPLRQATLDREPGRGRSTSLLQRLLSHVRLRQQHRRQGRQP